jgi:hypothetical protein
MKNEEKLEFPSDRPAGAAPAVVLTLTRENEAKADAEAHFAFVAALKAAGFVEDDPLPPDEQTALTARWTTEAGKS